MNNPTKTNKTEEKLFQLFRLFTEAIAWLRIVASPLLIGLILGTLTYLYNPNKVTFVLGLLLSILGLVIGILWANKQWRGKGAVWFMSWVTSTQDLKDQDKTEDLPKS
ncbi:MULTISPECIES: hypothetical protein [Amniculibacterium]|jgi:uncharacterized membrane protein YbjE (DUF340 family)|uniref:hypothetical protein n=1 Tax=Amniculibacterium TaxID=2715289 RepID=UPI000F5A6322|nr:MULTISPECIES: hypothetical protein [Amniculibacterium]